MTVFHAVSLFDEVTVTPVVAGSGSRGDSVSVAGEGAREVPEDDVPDEYTDRETDT